MRLVAIAGALRRHLPPRRTMPRATRRTHAGVRREPVMAEPARALARHPPCSAPRSARSHGPAASDDVSGRATIFREHRRSPSAGLGTIFRDHRWVNSRER
jgi:hypothetical protein